MATLTIRNLPEQTRLALKEQAARHNRSMEAEAREILQSAVAADRDFVMDWVYAAQRLAGDFELPPRSPARTVDFV
ncbi:MAG: plasmid stabilization protein [Tessaracoccus sp.]